MARKASERRRPALLRITRAVALACATLVAPFAQAATIDLSLTNPSAIESTTLVINSALGYAHPPLQVYDWDEDGLRDGGVEVRAIDLGSGRDGVFDATTILKFHSGVYNNDGVIVIDAAAHPVLEFTSFNLPAGYTLTATGPLVIRSLSDIQIDGALDCSGRPGSSANNTGLVAAGGAGRCGGSPGGNGGSSSAAGQDAGGSSASLRDGLAPHALASAKGGGGGASASANTNIPANGVGTIATAGTSGNDTVFSIVAGGGGGGGGEGGAGALAGGGGGAGGGTISLSAARDLIVSATGSISVKGGDGGGGAFASGGGGGGGGGSLLMFAGRTMSFAGPVQVAEGQEGVTTGSNGGHGGTGRVWVSDNDGLPDGGAQMDSTLGGPFDWGTVQALTGAFEIVSSQIDLGSPRVEIHSSQLDATLATGNSAVVEYAAADIPFAVPFNAAAVRWTTLAEASGHRYLRLRIRVDNQNALAPAALRKLTLSYDPIQQTQFDYASCSLVRAGSASAPGGGGAPFTTVLLLAPILLALWLRNRRPTKEIPARARVASPQS